jgi:hypothetical protein
VARPDLGTHSDTLANLELGDLGADLDDLANDLVAGDDEFGGEGTPASGDGVVVLHEHTGCTGRGEVTKACGDQSKCKCKCVISVYETGGSMSTVVRYGTCVAMET